jgi:uncharacterized membrane protein HdeD (DUF308 family)
VRREPTAGGRTRGESDGRRNARLVVTIDKRGRQMANSSELSNLHRGLRESLNARWGLLMFQGVVLVILGALAIAMPFLATIAVEIYVGWLFLIAGVIGLIGMFSAHHAAAFLWTLVTAALSLALGVLLLWKPIAGVETLTLALTAFFVAEGVFQIATSVAYRQALPGTWGWLLASGVCDLILVAIIVSSWPVSASWTLGLIAGVNLLTSGAAIIMAASAARDIMKTTKAP